MLVTLAHPDLGIVKCDEPAWRITVLGADEGCHEYLIVIMVINSSESMNKPSSTVCRV